MRTNLRNGKLITPQSIARARERCSQLAHEITRVEDQLKDMLRRGRLFAPTKEGGDAYIEWRGRAKQALKLFQSEHSQLGDWIDSHLLKKAFAILKELRDVDELEFNEDELDVIAQLEDHLNDNNKHHDKERKIA